MRFLVFCLIVFLSLVQPVLSHPPSQVDLTYNKEKHILDVKMIHVVGSMREHHIRKVIVYRNGAVVREEYMRKQTNNKELKLSVALDASSGDTIMVKAICNKAGYGEESIKIPEDEKETEE